MTRTLVLASGNSGKLRELEALLDGFGLDLQPQTRFDVDPVEETGLTFIENAILKARHACRISGFPALADDSGIAVDALDGAPGIRSARFAGERATDADNNNLLLERLEGLSTEQRSARYHCVLVLMRHGDDPAPLVCEGSWAGSIGTAPRGDGGFGYDPLFLVGGDERTAAELPAEEKNRISHRGQAMALLRARLTDRRW